MLRWRVRISVYLDQNKARPIGRVLNHIEPCNARFFNTAPRILNGGFPKRLNVLWQDMNVYMNNQHNENRCVPILGQMPCPYFEPRHIVSSQYSNARLPLLQEHAGLCRAGKEPLEAPPAMRFRYCNHGYSRGICEHFPGTETRSCLRYQLTRFTGTEFEIEIIEEQDYAPAAWRAVKYSVGEDRLDPEIQDCCIRAQVVAFCRAYLGRFS